MRAFKHAIRVRERRTGRRDLAARRAWNEQLRGGEVDLKVMSPDELMRYKAKLELRFEINNARSNFMKEQDMQEKKQIVLPLKHPWMEGSYKDHLKTEYLRRAAKVFSPELIPQLAVEVQPYHPEKWMADETLRFAQKKLEAISVALDAIDKWEWDPSAKLTKEVQAEVRAIVRAEEAEVQAEVQAVKVSAEKKIAELNKQTANPTGQAKTLMKVKKVNSLEALALNAGLTDKETHTFLTACKSVDADEIEVFFPESRIDENTYAVHTEVMNKFKSISSPPLLDDKLRKLDTQLRKQLEESFRLIRIAEQVQQKK